VSVGLLSATFGQGRGADLAERVTDLVIASTTGFATPETCPPLSWDKITGNGLSSGAAQ
jgi:hypothetical protein